MECLLRSLKGLLCADALVGKGHLLSPLKRRLSSCEVLLKALQVRLLTSVERRLAALELLARALERLRGRDVLVRQHDLSGAIELSLSPLERLLGLLQACLLRPVQCRLRRLEGLLASLEC